MSLSPKENLLAALGFAGPEWVPLGNEGVGWGFAFSGNFRCASWTDTWGVRWEVGLEGTVPFPKGNPLPDLDRLGDYRLPNPDDLVFDEADRHALAALDRERRLVTGGLTYLLFERAWALMGMESFLLSLHTHPAELHALLHAIAAYARRVFERYLELGVDAVSFSEDLGTQRALSMSPAHFREFLLPEYRFIFEPVLAAGKMVFFHSCGCIQEVAGDLADLGVTALNPIQARANDLPRLKAETFGRMALDGGIDTHLLATGTPALVATEVERVTAILKPGGGWICRPDQGLPGIPEENMAALWATAAALGWY